MLICDSFEDIKAAIESTSEADYSARLEFVIRNKEKVASYAQHEEAAARIVQTAARRKTSQS
jgi:hypothetical protein